MKFILQTLQRYLHFIRKSYFSLDCKSYRYPKFYKHVLSFVGLTTLGTFIKFKLICQKSKLFNQRVQSTNYLVPKTKKLWLHTHTHTNIYFLCLPWYHRDGTWLDTFLLCVYCWYGVALCWPKHWKGGWKNYTQKKTNIKIDFTNYISHESHVKCIFNIYFQGIPIRKKVEFIRILLSSGGGGHWTVNNACI